LYTPLNLYEPSHPCLPFLRMQVPPHPSYPCTPPQYIYHKVVSHFTTWASRPSTTKKWLIAGYLGGDHISYTHKHEHIHGWGCMHARSCEVDLFIINACNKGSYQTIGIIVDCSVLVITLRMPPSMDTIRGQSGRHTFTNI
jgi:hypothetical protein